MWKALKVFFIAAAISFGWSVWNTSLAEANYSAGQRSYYHGGGYGNRHIPGGYQRHHAGPRYYTDRRHRPYPYRVHYPPYYRYRPYPYPYYYYPPLPPPYPYYPGW